jgi:hypothetical protein
MSEVATCPISRIDGEGNKHPCRRNHGHSGDHRYSLTYCPATQGDCEQACVGSNCNRIEKPFSVEVSAALAEASKALPCGHISPIGPSMLCDLALGHEGMHANGPKKSSWPTDGQVMKWAEEVMHELHEVPQDPIKPDYYHGTTVDDFIAEFKLGFRLGSVIKYVARHEHKDKIQDLKKAQWYLAREIEKLEGK